MDGIKFDGSTEMTVHDPQSQNWRLDKEERATATLIGEGGFGNVYRVRPFKSVDVLTCRFGI